MSDSSATRAPRSDEDLARELDGLGRWIAFPETPDLSLNTRTRISGKSPVPAPFITFNPGRRPVRWVIAAVLALIIGATIATPGLRHAIADVFGVPGIRIVFDDDTSPALTPAATTYSGELSLELGTLVNSEAAIAQAGFKIELPAASEIGNPDAIYTREMSGGVVAVSFVYLPDKDLPEAAETGVGALLMEFSGSADDIYFEKRVRMGGIVTETTVHGVLAFWLEGTTELVMVDELSALCCGPFGRPTANVLIWSENDVTFRLETALNFGEAWLIAESIGPVLNQPGTPNTEP